ncbi:hypothetical protein [Nitrospirillum pindoramense]|uniref:Aspartyl protease n=1 Tax=Nitrospirillum amazonense TaxID=28077 RepID=A0A560H2A1_9PROT|nr:hypothetical protein [Nitrospirillum amazonense]TWB40418.1 hypothetical protein FBZ90_10921 [Nitrospirillum amazonense]
MTSCPTLIANVRSAAGQSVWLDIYTEDNTPVLVNLDTGSNGLVLPYHATHDKNGNLYPWITKTTEQITRIYHPSGFTVAGTICTVSGLYFKEPNGNAVALNEIRALVCEEQHSGAMLGIGLGLVPTSTAQLLDNPFLNVTGQNPSFNLTLSNTDPNQVTVTLGQSASDLSDYKFLSLNPNAAAASGFDMPTINVTTTPPSTDKHGTTITNICNMLMDCGIPGMYLTDSAVPSVGAGNSLAKELHGYKITLAAANGSFSYHFTVGETGPGTPSYILQGGANSTGFVNTGINFLQVYSYYFDATTQQLGFQPVPPS